MRPLLLPAALLVAAAGAAHGAYSLDELQEALTWHGFDGNVRVRLSGLLDVEAYSLPQPPPGLIYTDSYGLVNPRFSLFLDAQLGPYVYAFAQARLDRGFDPADGKAEVRMDEYAFRVSPYEDGRMTVQVGKFATVIGSFPQRHLSWDNPFINAPLAYEGLTGVWDSEAPEDAVELLEWAHVAPDQLAGKPSSYGANYSDKYLRLPIVWGPSYATGASISGKLGKFEYAAEIKNAGVSSRPEKWDLTEVGFRHPAYAGRIGYQPDAAWRFGFSAAYGPFLQEEAVHSVPRGRSIGDYHQTTFGQDISFEWHHWQIWAECLQSRFQVARTGQADTLSYFIEAKYKFTPQLFGAVRWNQQFYGDVETQEFGRRPWGDDVWRTDVAVTYRFTPNAQIKLQYSLENERSPNEGPGNTFAAQLTLKF